MFKLLSENATMPIRATAGSAGYDLYAAETKTIDGEGGTVLIKTNVAAQCPPGTYGRIAIRSSLAYKQHLAVSAGVIDSDYYPNDIGVLVYCTKPGHKYTVTAGERFAQIVFERIYVDDNNTITTFRTGGYGSTNTNENNLATDVLNMLSSAKVVTTDVSANGPEDVGVSKVSLLPEPYLFADYANNLKNNIDNMNIVCNRIASKLGLDKLDESNKLSTSPASTTDEELDQELMRSLGDPMHYTNHFTMGITKFVHYVRSLSGQQCDKFIEHFKKLGSIDMRDGLSMALERLMNTADCDGDSLQTISEYTPAPTLTALTAPPVPPMPLTPTLTPALARLMNDPNHGFDDEIDSNIEMCL